MATLAGKTVLVVGGTSGIGAHRHMTTSTSPHIDEAVGFTVAEASLASQATHVIVASSSAQKVDVAVAKLEVLKAAGKVSGATVNAKDGESVKALMESVGEIDHLVWTSGDARKTGLFPDIDVDASRGVSSYTRTHDIPR